MSIETSYGFRSAQAAWENANPYDNECTCEDLYRCPNCEATGLASVICKDCTPDIPVLAGVPTFELELVDREDSQEEASQACPQHGWCGGCYSPKCEDCAP